MAQIKGKWAYSISNHPVMHEIMGYRGMSGDLVMRRLYDHNNIERMVNNFVIAFHCVSLLKQLLRQK